MTATAALANPMRHSAARSRRHAMPPWRAMRHEATATMATVAAPEIATTYTKLKWVCTRRLAMPTTKGAITRWPAARAQHMSSRHQNGSNMAWGCQASKSNSLPMLHASPADRAVVRTSARWPPARCAAQAAPTIAALLASITADGQADARSRDTHERGEHIEPQRARIADGPPGGL